jgi:hypothetical protein
VSFVAPTHLSLGVPAASAAAPLVVEVFDGDTSGTWDKPGGAVTTYQLFTDANRDGTGMQLLAQKTDAQMSDNAWTELFNGAHAPAAAAPSGNLFYRVVVTIEGDAGVLNAYKVALKGAGQISALQNEFSVIGGVVQTYRVAGTAPYDDAMASTDPMPTLNPSALNPLNTYDGTFTFKIYVPTSGASVSLQEGDADRVTDATAAVAAEAALPPKSGVPADGADGNVLAGRNVDYRAFRVGGPVRYTVKSPAGATLVTAADPSGDAEYETVPAFDTSAVGYYTLTFSDVDMRNTIFLKPAFGVEVFSPRDAGRRAAPDGTPACARHAVPRHERQRLPGPARDRPAASRGRHEPRHAADRAGADERVRRVRCGSPGRSYVASRRRHRRGRRVLPTTDGGTSPVVTVVNGQVKPATTSASWTPRTPTRTSSSSPSAAAR